MFIVVFTRAHHRLGHLNSIRTPKSCFRKLHFNIILPSTSTSSEWSLPFRLSSWSFARISILRASYMPCPFHLRWLDRPNNIWSRVKIMELLINSFPASVYIHCFTQLRGLMPYQRGQKFSFGHEVIERHRNSASARQFSKPILRKCLEWLRIQCLGLVSPPEEVTIAPSRGGMADRNM
jgi:hypothetical protein